MDKTGIEKRVLEEDVNELEREKVMLEIELENAGAKHKADLKNLEIQLAGAKDTESDLMQRIDLMNKDLEEMALKVRTQQASLIDQVWPLIRFFSVSFFCKKSLICLEAKSMTPHLGNTILCSPSQQLLRLQL